MSEFVDILTPSTIESNQISPINPVLYSVIEWITNNLTNNSFASLTNPLKTLTGNEDVINKLKELHEIYPLVINEKSKDKKKTFWSDIQLNQEQGQTGQTMPMDATETTTTAPIPSTATDIGRTVEIPVFTTGSVNPVEEFQAVISSAISNSDSGKLIKEAIATMTQIIILLVTRGSTNSHYRKAVNCVRVSHLLPPYFHVLERITLICFNQVIELLI
jgi:hypothetical protein